MIIGFKLNRKNIFVPNWTLFFNDEFRWQVWGLGILPFRYLAALKISIKSGADNCSTSLVKLHLENQQYCISKAFSINDHKYIFYDTFV